MPSLHAIDRALLMLLVPLWAFAWLSTALSLDRNVVVVPFFVDDAAAPDGFPIVTGFPSWTRAALQPEPALAVGDRVLAIADQSLAGAGAARVVSLAWAQMGNDGSLELDVERHGQRFEARVAIPASVPKWPVLPVSFAFACMAVLGALTAPRWPAMRAAWPAFLCTGFLLGSHFGRTPTELLLAFWMRGAALVAIAPLYVRLFRFFPSGNDEGVRWARGWPWLLGINGLVVIDMELYGRLPLVVTDYLPKLAALVFGALLLTIGTRNYRNARPVDRRRFKWLLLGTWVGIVPPAVVSTLSALRPELGRFYLPSQLSQLAVPLSVGIGLWRGRLWDIDRLLNAGIVYLGAAAIGVLIFIGVLGPVRSALVTRAELTPETAALAFALGLAALLIPVALTLRAALDRVVLRKQRARQSEIEALLPAIGRCEKLDEIVALLAQRLPPIFGVRGALVLADSGTGLVPVHATPEAPEIDEAERLLLATASAPCDLGAGLGIPLRDPIDDLALAAIVLDAKPPGDEYGAADRTLLGWVAERAVATARALRDEERLSAARRMAAELASARDRAEDESRDKTALLATASHDLRQPLHALGLLVDSLEHRVSGDEAQRLLRQVKSSALSVEQGFDTLLDVARIESGALRPEMIDGVPLAPLFEELRAAAEPLAREKGLRLRVRTPIGAVRTDPVLLRSILQNLLVNAVRYTPQGTVLLAARRRGESWRIEVRDSGPGIASEERERLFSAWERGEASAAGPEGVGLGLAIVRRLADRLGHRIELRSAPGRGSVFSVELEASAELPPPRDALAGLRAVVVDEDDEARAQLAVTLTGFGLRVDPARNLTELSAALAGSPAPDVALVDLRLAAEPVDSAEPAAGIEPADPAGSGSLAAFDARIGSLPVAFVTEESSGALLDAARASGRPVLPRPVAPVQLRAALLHLLPSGQRG